MSQPISILGIPFPTLTLRQAHRRLAAMLCESGKKVYTPNASILWQTHKNPSLRPMLLRADLLLPDGAGVILASRLCGTPLPARITGIDTAEWLLRYGAKKGYSFFFLGGKPGVAKRAADRWQHRLPALSVVGTHHGYFDKNGKENQRVLAKIRAAKPDILFVCFGFPHQEQWIDQHARALPSVHLFMGLGGSFDVWSGSVKRAPKAIQALGMEWLFRALCDPKRIKSLALLPAFLWVSGTRGRGDALGKLLKKFPKPFKTFQKCVSDITFFDMVYH